MAREHSYAIDGVEGRGAVRLERSAVAAHKEPRSSGMRLELERGVGGGLHRPVRTVEEGAVHQNRRIARQDFLGEKERRGTERML